jgi:putative membrane protein
MLTVPPIDHGRPDPAPRIAWTSLVLHLIYRWGCNIVALFVAAAIFSGIDYDGFWTLVVAGFVLSLVNVIIRPFAILLGIVFIILTLGIGLLFINALMILLTSVIVPSFDVSSFWTALGAAVIVWLANLALDAVLKPDFMRRRSGRAGIEPR